MALSVHAFRVFLLACLTFLMLLLPAPAAAAPEDRGFVETSNGANTALLVSVGHGLSGLDIDIKNAIEMISNPAYAFKYSHLHEAQGTVAAVDKELFQGAQDAKDDGTFLFYYTGHGNVGSIWLQDKSMTVKAIRAAIERARKGAGPLARLVLIYDSCHAGSMMDPMSSIITGSVAPFDPARETQRFVDAVVNELTSGNRDDGHAPYWSKLMVIASSRADESSLASANGSIFTLAMKKAFDEAIAANSTVGEFFNKAKSYTKGHTPVARFVPAGLTDEKMVP